jgi:hypothetical protein
LEDGKMVLVPRAEFASPTAGVTPARAGPPSRVASTSQNIDQPQASANVAFDASAFGFAEEGRGAFDRGGDRSRQHTPGLISAPSQTFASILESGDQFFSGGDDGKIRSPKFAGLVAKAIQIYETNAKVISGTNNVLGTSFSAVL